jgi:hypothetical protein
VLTILGDAGPNKIFVADDGSAGNYNITAKGDKAVLTSSAHVSTIKIQSLAGGDTITYVVSDLFSPRKLTVEAGTANDKVAMTSGTVHAPFKVFVDLGPGNDQFIGRVDGTDSSVDVEATGGAGNDKMSLLNTSDITTNQGSFYCELAGGSGNDVITVNSQGNMFGKKAVCVVEGEAGNDRLTVNSTGDVKSTIRASVEEVKGRLKSMFTGLPFSWGQLTRVTGQPWT